MEFEHIPVLLDEVVEGLAIRPSGIYVDCTVGGGGHSSEICRRLTTGRLIAIDQDEDALSSARKRLSAWRDRVSFHHANFESLADVLAEERIDFVDGILMDIGVSSYQLDAGERGFSYREDAPLDMRMDRRHQRTAAQIVNTYDEEQLAEIFWRYGEERWGKRIAQFVVAARKERLIETTGDLVDVIKKAVPKGARSGGKHPAKKVFQALRIEVNRELEVLESALNTAIDRLAPGGRLCVITFHSLEDRLAKRVLKEKAQRCICPPEAPVCTCHHVPEVVLITRKPIAASDEELKRNQRAHSAKLRVVEKI
ncbi:MAG: 16S rRNA (cytosine(1402)-N(4))-methyltransferase RsmH [Ndongobacter sp.]|nr:16S rRNA (cytosine(1402)-N(4))-methyltransferase RsmH [Ndongobacter sp.]